MNSITTLIAFTLYQLITTPITLGVITTIMTRTKLPDDDIKGLGIMSVSIVAIQQFVIPQKIGIITILDLNLNIRTLIFGILAVFTVILVIGGILRRIRTRTTETPDIDLDDIGIDVEEDRFETVVDDSDEEIKTPLQMGIDKVKSSIDKTVEIIGRVVRKYLVLIKDKIQNIKNDNLPVKRD